MSKHRSGQMPVTPSTDDAPESVPLPASTAAPSIASGTSPAVDDSTPKTVVARAVDFTKDGSHVEHYCYELPFPASAPPVFDCPVQFESIRVIVYDTPDVWTDCYQDSLLSIPEASSFREQSPAPHCNDCCHECKQGRELKDIAATSQSSFEMLRKTQPTSLTRPSSMISNISPTNQMGWDHAGKLIPAAGCPSTRLASRPGTLSS